MNKTMKDQMLQCPNCGEYTLHPRRKELGYHVCVNCSTTKPLVGRIVTLGTGDHTCNELEIMTQEQAREVARLEAYARGQKAPDVEILDYDQDDDNVQREVTEKTASVLDEDDYVQPTAPQHDSGSALEDLVNEQPENG